jgi:hypothetical protein
VRQVVGANDLRRLVEREDHPIGISAQLQGRSLSFLTLSDLHNTENAQAFLIRIKLALCRNVNCIGMGVLSHRASIFAHQGRPNMHKLILIEVESRVAQTLHSVAPI